MARLSMPPLLGRIWREALRSIEDFRREWSRARIGGLSAEIAFFALLGLFPAVLVFAAALGSLDVVIGADAAADAKQWLLDRVAETFGSDNTLQATVGDLFDQSNAGVITVGVLGTLYASSRGFTAVVGALDVIYGHEYRRSWYSTRFMGIALTLLTAVAAAVVVAMVVVGPLFGGGEELAERLGAGSLFTTAWDWFRWPVVFVVVICWTASTYHYAPRLRIAWRTNLLGAMVGTTWWLVVSGGFRVYLDAASRGVNPVLGLLGGALILLVWFYLLAMGLLVGAAINRVLIERRVGEVETKPAP